MTAAFVVNLWPECPVETPVTTIGMHLHFLITQWWVIDIDFVWGNDKVMAVTNNSTNTTIISSKRFGRC